MIWKNLPDAHRDRPVLLFLPRMEVKSDEGGHSKPTGKFLDEYAVGSWDERERCWKARLLGGGAAHVVFPSLWTEIEAPPHTNKNVDPHAD